MVLLGLSQLLPMVRGLNPIFFPCDNDVKAEHVDCSQRKLTHIPRIKSTSVTSLNISHNKIEMVGREAFSDIPNLKILDLMWNCLPGNLRDLGTPSCQMEIHRDALRSLQKLRILRLSGNSLSTLPWLPDTLQVLNLGYNRLFNINEPLGTPKLQRLFLTKNCYYANPCNQSFHINESVFNELSNLTELDLGFTNVTSIPPGLPPSLQHLDMRENKITEVPEGAFYKLTKLTYLNLEWNCQRCDHAAQPCFPCLHNAPLKLHRDSFKVENSLLTFLSLRGNSLRTFPEGLFSPLRRLTGLDISDNLLSDAMRNGTFFQELRSLTWLSLIYNYKPEKTYPDLVLSHHLSQMTDLKHLLLSGNFFLKLSSKSLTVLRKLHQLESLELRMNFIRFCDLSALAQLKALKNVDLSQNLLNFFPKCTNHSMYQLPQNQDGYIRVDHQNPPPVLWDRREPWDPPGPTASAILPARDMTDNSEDDVTQIPTIWDFRKMLCNQSMSFDLSQNVITSIKGDVFKGMERTVCLDLSYNYMSQALNGKQFVHLDNLVYLNMASNRIDFYYDDAFGELNATLKVLDLSKNEFHFLMRGMGHRFGFIYNLRNLEVLSLDDNDIGMRIDRSLNNTSIKYLYFAGNHLDIMWDSGDNYLHFFKDLTNLVYLDISRNQLRSLSQEVICNLPQSLQALRLSDNLLKYFPWENITVLWQLRHLNISSNHLSSLPNKVITFGSNFTLLDLSHNRISLLPETFFSKLEGLRYLYLSYNRLKLMDHQTLPPPLRNGSSLQILTLHGNPFTCSCDTSWFGDFLRASPVHIPFLTTFVDCEFPESLQGTSLLTVDPRSCQEIFGSVAFLCTSFLVLVFTALPLLKYLYGWDLWYGFQVMWAGLKGYSQLPGNDFHDHYDAFVVFDTENKSVRDWVYNEMMVQLENAGHRRFHLCLEERDWVPGLSCIENLHNAVYRSRKTVFILTSTGTGSDANMNGIIRQVFYMVQQRLLDEKVDVAVLVLLDEVFPKMKYLQLRKRLCRKSVLSWPKNPRAQPLFWNNMRAVLSSDNLRSYDRNISESFML